MTYRAIVGIGAFEVRFVSESHRSRFFDLKRKIRDFMALGTILQIESPFAVWQAPQDLPFSMSAMVNRLLLRRLKMAL